MKTTCKILWIAALLLSHAAVDAAVINIPVRDNAPPLVQAAAPDHPFWQDAVRLEGLTEFTRAGMPHWNSSVALTATAEALYLQVCARMPRGTEPKMVERNRDGAVYFDDCIEVGLTLPGMTPDAYWQFSVNPANTVFDAFRGDRAWNGKWESRTLIQPDQWCAVLRIPFADLGLKEAPERMYCNIARSRLTPEVEQSVLVRSSPELFFGNLDRAATLRFGRNLPAGTMTVASGGDTPVVRVRALTLPEEKFADFRLNICDPSGKSVAKASGQSRFDSVRADLPIPALPDGRYLVELVMEQAREYLIPAYYGGGSKANGRLAAGEAPAVYLEHRWPLTVDNAPALNLKVKLRQAGRQLNAVLEPRSVICSPQAFYRASLCDAAGKAVQDLGRLPYAPQPQPLVADIGKLPERTRLQLRVELVDDGEVLVAASCPFATPPAPVWTAPNPDRPDDRVVPPPWTPVRLQGMTASCWNRTFEFSPTSPVPCRIVSGGVPLLKSPGRIVSTPEITWQLRQAKVQNPGCVRFDYLGKTADGAEVRAFSELYFDGVVRTDLELPPGAVFSRLELELPYRKEVASFVHHGPGLFGGMFNIRTLGKAETHSYLPNFMLLNDEVGLGWFDGMPFDWPLAQNKRVVEMLPEADRVLLRVRYIDHAKSYDRSRTFSWGLQGFPARPLPEKETAMRLCYTVRYGDEDRVAWYSTVDYFADRNLDPDRGALELKFKLSEIGGDEPLVQLSHGEPYQVRIGVDAAGKLYAFEHEHFRDSWRMRSAASVKTGVWNALGLNWNSEKIELFLNGEKVSEVRRGRLMRVMPTLISVGGIHAVADDFRISSAPRRAFALQESPAADDRTLLCDHFDRMRYVNGRRATVPLKISEDTEAGYLMPDTRLVPGVRGLAVGPLTVPTRSLLQGYAALGFEAVCYHASQYTDEAFSGLYIADEKKFTAIP